jgi:hypothetical protein
MKPEDRKRLKQHIEMIVEHKEPTQTEKILRDAIEEQIKGKLELEDKNRKLRAELNALRVKTSQQERFIWWIWNVYSRNVIDLIYDIMGATTYDTEGEAKDGKYALPKHCFDLMKRIDEYTEHIYDGTYLDTAMSTEQSNSDVSMTQDVLTDIKTGQSIEKETCSWIQEDDPEICYWKTGCGNSFYFTEGTPTDNNMKYCCYCGKLLKQED